MDANVTVTATANDNEKKVARSGFATRIFSFSALAALVSTVGYVGTQAYRAATDSFVAPIILSPDNDLLVGNKVKMMELAVERTKARAQVDAIDADVAALEHAVSRLKELQEKATNAVVWTAMVTAGQVSAASAEMQALADKKTVLAEMLEKQKSVVKDSNANMKAGLVSKAELAREVQALDEVLVALLETKRSGAQVGFQLQQAVMAKKALASGGPSSAPTPEMLVREDQIVRIELEILKLETEQRTKRAEKIMLADKLSKLEELESQLKGRPIFRAVEQSMDLAFVPYTQIDGMQAGADVYDCVWGMFACKRVGRVTEIVSGEAIHADPWGNQARGQYAVLDLVNHDAARSKTLRVRSAGRAVTPAVPKAPGTDGRVSLVSSPSVK